MSGTFEGRQAIFDDYLGHPAHDFETITSEITRTIAEGDVVVVEYQARGRTLTGRDYDTTYYYIIDVVDGVIQTVHQSLDTLYTQQTLYD